MLLVFLDQKPVGIASPELEKEADQSVGPIEAYGIFQGAMTTWYPPQEGMREAGVTKLVTLQRFKPSP